MFRKNSIYLSSPAIYLAVIEQNNVEQFTKFFDEYQNALDWCLGMCGTDSTFTFKLLDSASKRVLESGKAEIAQDSELEKGIQDELEHKELIVKMLLEAGKEPSEDNILEIAKKIAQKHLEKNPHYYSDIEKAGL